MRFTEAQLEKAFIELLEQEGFAHRLGNTIARAADEVLIEEPTYEPILITIKDGKFAPAP